MFHLLLLLIIILILPRHIITRDEIEDDTQCMLFPIHIPFITKYLRRRRKKTIAVGRTTTLARLRGTSQTRAMVAATLREGETMVSNLEPRPVAVGDMILSLRCCNILVRTLSIRGCYGLVLTIGNNIPLKVM